MRSGLEATGLPARRLALQVLAAVFDEGRAADEFLDASSEAAALAPRDRAFLVALTQAVFRHKAELDALSAQFLSKPLPRKAGLAPLILLSAAAQLRVLKMAPHAVIDTAVHLARQDRNAMHFAGLINAVLHKVAASPGDPPAARHAPGWLFARWQRDYGVETARLIDAANATEAALDLTVKADPGTWAKKLAGVALPTGTVRLAKPPGPVTALAGFADGAWWVQDAASAIPARLFGDVMGKTCLDLCAAPGGKTLQLAAAGAEVTAVDVSRPRLERLVENLARTKLRARIIAADVLHFTPDEPFDCVLLDAPCSATGTLRRHPDLAHRRSAEQVDALVGLQQKLLARAAGFVKPGGRLVYATCSLDRQEGEAQVARFLKGQPDFGIAPLVPGEAGLEPHFISTEGCFRSLPQQTLGQDRGLDGFFAARLARKT